MSDRLSLAYAIYVDAVDALPHDQDPTLAEVAKVEAQAQKAHRLDVEWRTAFRKRIYAQFRKSVDPTLVEESERARLAQDVLSTMGAVIPYATTLDEVLASVLHLYPQAPSWRLTHDMEFLGELRMIYEVSA